ncbi:HK97 gp10 family phage protein [Methylomicrobium lacus]|uniref:HK97 gp10 family phage protein n=1 Tax=Methylomicrobium lacus TaxID=136992 RepID=UPI00045E6757|nr:HK97 gp10 family phage protein [Methylomicrobium lacus]
MIRVEIDLGRIPSVLQALADPALVDKAVNAAAESFNDDIHDWINSGRAFTPRSRGGGLEQNINWRPAGSGVAEVYAKKDYAEYVEKGTGIHVGHRSWIIGPKPGRKGVAYDVPGGYVVRRPVEHPGSRPYPYMFADLDNRKERMSARVLSVLAAHAGGEHG